MRRRSEVDLRPGSAISVGQAKTHRREGSKFISPSHLIRKSLRHRTPPPSPPWSLLGPATSDADAAADAGDGDGGAIASSYSSCDAVTDSVMSVTMAHIFDGTVQTPEDHTRTQELQYMYI